jgi:hypothetical protein
MWKKFVETYIHRYMDVLCAHKADFCEDSEIGTDARLPTLHLNRLLKGRACMPVTVTSKLLLR